MASFYAPIDFERPCKPHSIMFGALDLSPYICGLGFDRQGGDVEILLTGFSHAFRDDLYLLYVRSSQKPQPLYLRNVAVLVSLHHYTQDVQTPNAMQPYAITAIEGKVIRRGSGMSADWVDYIQNTRLQRRLLDGV